MAWKISRAGVVNFWYYDEEEFHFEDGRLLLRGANGSGKSVTMQSLVPLLFDGNKSPERLDPFGSKARKMESYLLSDGLEVEERTGYLFLEFEKKEAQRHMTIGMGMRARKNRPMQTWYFLLLDNRRIGKNYDFTLYRDMGDKIPLTQKELENKIDIGGHVYTKQSDYKAAVNEHLFGYSDITDFDELITLLIQIRSPKLSKEFKPTTMYEIMQNSLVTLTDEDLRPMAEAIENMDEIKLKIDALERSKKSLNRIQTAFDKYNSYMLTTKATRFLKHLEEETTLSKSQEKFKKERVEATTAIEAANREVASLETESSRLKETEASLLSHDLANLALEGEQLKSDIDQYREAADKKRVKLKRQEAVTTELAYKVKAQNSDLDAAVFQGEKLLVLLDEEAEVAGFDEHHFFADTYKKEREAAEFKYHKAQVEAYKKRVKDTAKALNRQAEVRQAYDVSLEKVDSAVRQLADQKRFVKETEQQFNQIKEEFAVSTFAWAKHNRVLDIPRQILQQVTERIFSYNAPYRFDQAIEPLRTAYEASKGEVHMAIHREKSAHQQVKETIAQLKDRYQTVEKQQDMAPERTEATVKNRKRLEALGIDYVPLYKVLDFNTELSETQKGVLEEALEAMGLLDALIVHEQHKSQVLAMTTGEAERYLFATPEYLSHNLTAFFKVEAQGHPFEKSTVEDVLMSVFINETENRFYITEAGHYGMGPIRGKVSGDKPSRFVGHLARKRYRERLLREIEAEISVATAQLSAIEGVIEKLNEKLNTLQKEWEHFPNNDDLDVAYTTFFEAEGRLKLLEKEVTYYREASEVAFQLLKDVQLEVAIISKGLYLNLTLEVYEEAETAMENYLSAFTDWHQLNQKIHYIEVHLKTLREQSKISEDAEVTLRDDIEHSERAERKAMVRLEDIEAQLKLSNFEDIKAEIADCRKRLLEIPTLLKGQIKAQSDNEAKVTHLDGALQQLETQRKSVAEKRALYERAFVAERELGYVETGLEGGEASETKVLAKQAKALLIQFGDFIQDQKTILHYTDALKEKFLSESGELAEYQMRFEYLFKALCTDTCSDDDLTHIERVDIKAKVQGKVVSFKVLNQWVEQQIVESTSVLDEQDRALFEEILINSISKKIGAKIYHSERWVRKIDELMNSMDTSSGLSFHLKWVTKEAASEEQLSTKELVSLLKGEQALLTRAQKDKLIRHFQSKIGESKRKTLDATDTRSFLTIMKEVLDYRTWFEFRLDYTKKGERRRELTNNAFYTFSGGEKAMAMYVPLFSAVYAKYAGANRECPKLVSLDEAFAGVDEKNITDMFRLLTKELDLGFIANSQVLFGDYETVPSLAIYELIRPENATYVTTIRYIWNGTTRELVAEH